MSGTNNLIMIGRLLGLPREDARARARELLARFELTDAAARATKTYSGGMRRRLDLAASLVGHPRVLYLDEPATGLDPRSRTDVWGMIRDLVADGVTVLLTTQYLDEADQLAHDIVVIDHGKVGGEQHAELADQAGSLTEGQVGLDPVRQHAGAKLGQPGRGRVGEVRSGRVGERLAPPGEQRVPQDPRGLVRVAVGQRLAAPGGQRLERHHVDRVRRHGEGHRARAARPASRPGRHARRSGRAK
jgi:oleandomycin transport system ATP-binding protein